jgi:hypothetical protein
VNIAKAARPYYMIGNSLTNDATPQSGILMLGRDIGRYLSPGYHIRGSAPLNYFVAHPEDAEIAQGGPWDEALPARARSFYTFQPYYSSLGFTSTLQSDIDSIRTLSEAVESGRGAEGQRFIYFPWPSISDTGEDYQAFWNAEISVVVSTPTVIAKAFQDALLSACREDDSRINLIPVGQVMNAVDVAARAGDLPGVATVNDLHRDGIHMGTAGRFIAAASVVTCFAKMRCVPSADTVAYFQSLGGSEVELTEELADLLCEIVWQTCGEMPETGVSTR